ncbi:hypothetical protein LCGC14_3100280 [marine sediment metagenome]|uniref:Uncharacterized protein n=1 Tax=marine sediment metagenome TaxID=412755 RepID=A0A0F8W8G3_9ZZZZ
MSRIKTVSVRFNGCGSRALFDVENEQHAKGLAEVVDRVKRAMLDSDNNDSFSVSVDPYRGPPCRYASGDRNIREA